MPRPIARAFPLLLASILLIALWWRPVWLADAAGRRGLLEWMVALILRNLSTLSVGTLLAWINALIAFTALALMGRSMNAAAQSMLATCATLAAFAATVTFDRYLAPADGLAALALGSYAWLQVWQSESPPGRAHPGRMAKTLIPLAVIPVLSPRFFTEVTDLSRIGALPFALAALGAWSALPALRRGWAVVLALTVIAPLPGFWCLAARGLAATVHAAGRRSARLVVATALVLIVPLLQLQRLTRRSDPAAVAIQGHNLLTADTVLRALRALPEATLVQEDASIALLLDAIGKGRRIGKPLRIVPRSSASVGEALGSGRVFALPSAQLELQHRGFRLRPADTVEGIAEVESAGGCVEPATQWTDVPALTNATRFTQVAASPDARDVVHIYLGGERGSRPAAAGWQARDLRGFHTREYDRQRRPDLAAALRAEGIVAGSPLLDAPVVTRVTLWRTPGAPLALPVTLDAPARVAVARKEPNDGSSGVELCPSFHHIVKPLGTVRQP